MTQQQTFRKALLRTTALAGVAAVGVGAGFAQPAEGESGVEQITVTGSRIARPELTANSPISVVDELELKFTGTVNTEDLLNQLPQVIPGLTGQTNNPGNGSATVDLRSLGTARTLVLVNGSRLIPANNGGQSVDLNMVPAPLIERIEVVTGGASATYGSDAVAGVVNFILRDDFEGVQIDSQYEITDETDGQIFQTSVTIGANTPDGRGNVTFFGSFTDRDTVFQGDRDFSFFALEDDFDADGNPITTPGGSSGTLGGTLFFAEDCAGAGSGNGTATFGCTFDAAGNPRPFDSNTGDGSSDFYNYAPVNFLQLPQERWNFSSFAHYEITDHVEAYASAIFNQNRSGTQLAPTPAFLGFGVTRPLEFNINDPRLTPNQAAAIASTGTPDENGDIDVLFGRRLNEVGPREQIQTNNSFQMRAGFRGDFGFLNDNFFLSEWNWDISYQFGRVVRNDILLGDVSADLFVEGVNGCPAGGDACVPFIPFGPGSISADAADFIEINVNEVVERKQQVANGFISGDLPFALPTAENNIALALGFEYREDTSSSFPSQALAAGDVLGFNDSPPIEGFFSVWEIFGEVYVPLLEGLPFAEVLAIEAKGRYSDYSTIAGVTTYAFAGEYAPIEDIRLRGNYQRAVRAPNIAELFAPQANLFPNATDPCSNLEDTTGTLADLCVATGVPVSALGTNIQPNAQIQSLSGGNPGLQEETSTSWTIGAVIQPRFVDNLAISIDYFDIEVEDAIAPFGGGTNNILNTCYNIVQDPSSPFCQAITRTAGGTVDLVEAFSRNIAILETSGVDANIQYNFSFGDFGMDSWDKFGTFGVNSLITYTFENSFTADPISPVQDCVGLFGPTCGGGQSELAMVTTFNWNLGPVNTFFRWRYLGGRTQESSDSAFGGSFADQPVQEIEAFNYLDISVLYDATDYLQVRAGVDNLFDKEPPILGDSQQQANTFPAVYDVLGRTFRVGGTLRF